MHQKIFLDSSLLPVEDGVKKENQEYTGQENGHLKLLFRHINHLRIIQKYLLLLLEMMYMETMEMR